MDYQSDYSTITLHESVQVVFVFSEMSQLFVHPPPSCRTRRRWLHPCNFLKKNCGSKDKRLWQEIRHTLDSDTETDVFLFSFPLEMTMKSKWSPPCFHTTFYQVEVVLMMFFRVFSRRFLFTQSWTRNVDCSMSEMVMIDMPRSEKKSFRWKFCNDFHYFRGSVS